MFVSRQLNTTVELWWQLSSPLDRTIAGHWNNSCSVETNKWTRRNKDNISICMEYFHSVCNRQQTCTKKGNRLWPSQTSDNWNDHNRVAHQDDECWIILTQLQWRNSTSHSTVCLIITRLQWITHLLYTSWHRALSLFLPPAMWDLTPVSDDMQWSFVVRCFSPILWFYLQIIQF